MAVNLKELKKGDVLLCTETARRNFFGKAGEIYTIDEVKGGHLYFKEQQNPRGNSPSRFIKYDGRPIVKEWQ